MKRSVFLTLLVAGILAFAGQAAALEAVPSVINYQGKLSGSDGVPLSGNYTLRFTVYDHPVTGNTLWQESQNVTLVNGRFNVLLGAVTPITSAVFQTPNAHLGLKVNNDPEMSPRSRIGTVGYAFKAQDAATVNGLRANEISAGGTVEGVTKYITSSGTTTLCSPLVDIPAGARFVLLYESYSSAITNVQFFTGPFQGAATQCLSNKLVAEPIGKGGVGLVFSGNQRIWWQADNPGGGTYKATISGEIRY